MRIIKILLVFTIIFSLSGISYAQDVDYEEEDTRDRGDSGSSALGGAVMGGLLGAGLGAAIGSASGKAGQGAAIGGGIGAVGGTLIAAEKERNEKAARPQYRTRRVVARPDEADADAEDKSADMKNVKPKKRIIRKYDPEGNVISEKEVKE